ncbi:hypothetical protein ACQ5SI_12900 [Peribacillus frigoritolerans]
MHSLDNLVKNKVCVTSL